MKQQKRQNIEIVGPAVVTSMHLLDVAVTDGNGKAITGKYAFRHETQFERACRLGQLVDKARCTDDDNKKIEIERALDRKEAGELFDKMWRTRMGGTKDNLDLTKVRCSAAPAGASDAQIDAGRFLRNTELAMSPNDYQLVTRVIWQNCSISEAVMSISPSYRESTLARFREAMDGLITGERAAHRAERDRRKAKQ